MCHFITLVTDAPDVAAVGAALKAHGRRAEPAENASISSLLKPDERPFLAIGKAGCDCGTVLGDRRLGQTDAEIKTAAARLRRKGWSEARIERSLAQSRANMGRNEARGADSLAFWSDVIEDLLHLPGATSAGVVVHAYSGPLDEAFVVTRRAWAGNDPVMDGLASLDEDELLMFGRGGPARESSTGRSGSSPPR